MAFGKTFVPIVNIEIGQNNIITGHLFWQNQGRNFISSLPIGPNCTTVTVPKRVKTIRPFLNPPNKIQTDLWINLQHLSFLMPCY